MEGAHDRGVGTKRSSRSPSNPHRSVLLPFWDTSQWPESSGATKHHSVPVQGLCPGSSRRSTTSALGAPGSRPGQQGLTPGPLFQVQAKLALAPARRRRRLRRAAVAPEGHGQETCHHACRHGATCPALSSQPAARGRQGGPAPAHLARAAPSPRPRRPPPRRRQRCPGGSSRPRPASALTSRGGSAGGAEGSAARRPGPL